MKYTTRYEVTSSLAAGGSILKVYKTLEEAKSFNARKDFLIFETVIGVSDDSKRRYRISSKRVY